MPNAGSRFSRLNLVAGPFRTLIVGGGPDLKHNQVAIESNVRYVRRLLPTGATARILFTDGNPDSKNVLCEGPDKKTYYRLPQISRIDGPSDLGQVHSELASIATDASSNPTGPVLLYFTGHGSPNPLSEYNNNNYDLWDSKHLTVKNLASSLKAFPKSSPITLVMVECFSGAFGNVLFEDAEPKGTLADLNICGFFASVSAREAAGCTSEVNEANYRDFTSYFFSALSGIDRLGKAVSGADYNHDGRVGMNEAFAYSLIHDDSIDTPVCTSDVFLRRFVEVPDKEVMATPFHDVQTWASPAQLAALNFLGNAVHLTDDDCVQKAYSQFLAMDIHSMELDDVHLLRFVRLAKSIVLAHRLRTSTDESLKARFAALLQLESANPLH
jgi:hypothetical protein